MNLFIDWLIYGIGSRLFFGGIFIVDVDGERFFCLIDFLYVDVIVIVIGSFNIVFFI